MSTPDCNEYTEGRVQQLMAEDGRLAEQGIDVLRDDDGLLLRGEVESPQRRERIRQIVTGAFPGVRIRYEIGVTAAEEPPGMEEI